jgi:hypothetical protein
MLGKLGCALVGSDRAVSADTFALGSLIEKPGAGAAAAAGADAGGEKGADAGTAAVGDAAHVLRFEAEAGPGQATGAASAAATRADAAASPSRAQRRVKPAGMVAYAHNPAPHPAVAPLTAAYSRRAGGGASDAASGSDAKPSSGTAPAPSSAPAAAATAARDVVGYMRGVAAHKLRGGDNPFPEALVAAYVPAAARDIAAAFSALTVTVTGATAAAEAHRASGGSAEAAEAAEAAAGSGSPGAASGTGPDASSRTP